MSPQFGPNHTTKTTAELRTSHRAYVVASVLVVVVAVASWVVTGHPAGMSSLPLVVVFLALDAQIRKELARRQAGAQN